MMPPATLALGVGLFAGYRTRERAGQRRTGHISPKGADMARPFGAKACGEPRGAGVSPASYQFSRENEAEEIASVSCRLRSWVASFGPLRLIRPGLRKCERGMLPLFGSGAALQKNHEVQSDPISPTPFPLCRIHQSLRVTPAMEAGIADRVWTVGEMLS